LSKSSDTNVKQDADSAVQTQVISMDEVFNSTVPVICALTKDDNLLNLSGTVYYSGNKMFRGEFNSLIKQTGQEFDFYVIYKEGYSYSWNSVVNDGLKANFKQEEKNEVSFSDIMGPDTFSGEGFVYNCNNWKVDSSMFDVPQGIEFTDVSRN